MNEAELKCLLDAASLAQIDPTGLKPINPYTQTGERAQAMQMAVVEVNPAQAARWRLEAGESVSLASAAAKAGLSPMTADAEKELSELDADFITGQQEAKARREAELLDQMEKRAEELAATREKQQASFARSAGQGGSASGQHNRDFLQRLGVQNASQLNNIPARRVLGK